MMMSDSVCYICRSDVSLVEHHLSYFPEVTVDVCSDCHNIIHDSSDRLSRFEPDNPRPYRYHKYPKDVSAAEMRESDIFYPWTTPDEYFSSHECSSYVVNEFCGDRGDDDE
jgi:hypothetical protein